ncbi:MAG: hypothetical protein MUE40_01020 [Anaerolineae bacterium]|nr:hypothetical protein [Anaerolineae bacterium]
MKAPFESYLLISDVNLMAYDRQVRGGVLAALATHTQPRRIVLSRVGALLRPGSQPPYVYHADQLGRQALLWEPPTTHLVAFSNVHTWLAQNLLPFPLAGIVMTHALPHAIRSAAAASLPIAGFADYYQVIDRLTQQYGTRIALVTEPAAADFVVALLQLRDRHAVYHPQDWQPQSKRLAVFACDRPAALRAGLRDFFAQP